MGKFSNKVIGHTFVSLEEMVCDIVEEYKDGEDIEIYVACDEVADLTVALLSTGLFTPLSIEFATPEINGYSFEYLIAIHNDGSFFVEKTWNEDKEMYLYGEPDYIDAVFVSDNVDINLVEHLINEGYNGIIYYDFGDTIED